MLTQTEFSIAAQLETVTSWTAELDQFVEQIRHRFARSETRIRVKQYLQGLLSTLERKNCWQLAEASGEQTPYGFQHLLGRAKWDAEAVRDDVRSYVLKHLGDPNAVLILDDTGFLKQGDHSAGVQRQYTGTSGQVDNCQLGVFLVYATPKSYAFIDRELYLPKSWTGSPERCQQAHIPESVGFMTKPQLARQMLERTFKAGITAHWVTADEFYGRDHQLRHWLEQRRQAYVMAIPRNEIVRVDALECRVDELAASWPGEEWVRLSCGKGSKGSRDDDWIRMGVNCPHQPDWSSDVLVRRSLEAPHKLDYFSVFAPQGTPLINLVQAAGCRWKIETSFEDAKGEVGLDHYEVRSWQGWYRHITLSMLAHAYLSLLRMRQATAEGYQRWNSPCHWKFSSSRMSAPLLLPLTLPEIRRLLWQLIWQRPCGAEQVLQWSYWRRRHQTLAQHYHYQRRLSQSRAIVELAGDGESLEAI